MDRPLAFVEDENGASVTLRTNYYQTAPLGDLFSGPITPQIAPLESLRIDNLSTSGLLTTTLSDSPELTWMPPKQGVPDYYDVRVYNLQSTFSRTERARLRTAGTSIRIPPGTLETGERYTIEIRAIVAHDTPMAGLIGRTSVESYAGHTTHIIMPE